MSAEAREPKHGEHMIEVKVRFWTDSLAGPKGSVKPWHGWTSGAVRLSANEAHGIVPAKAVMFNSLAEIPRAIERALIANRVILHHADRDRRYVMSDEAKT
jgi:hypothetical protein